MGKVICCLAALLLITAGALHADTYTISIPCAGSYSAGHSYTANLDFGQTFSSIQSMSITWAGTIRAGYTYGNPLNPYDDQVLAGNMLAYLYTNDRNIAWTAGVSGGESTYPTPEPFDCTSTFVSYPGNHGSWDCLLDGRAPLLILGDSIIVLDTFPPPQVIQPSYYLYSATVTLNATPVPEPATVLSLSSLMCAIPLIRRGRRV